MSATDNPKGSVVSGARNTVWLTALRCGGPAIVVAVLIITSYTSTEHETPDNTTSNATIDAATVAMGSFRYHSN